MQAVLMTLLWLWIHPLEHEREGKSIFSSACHREDAFKGFPRPLISVCHMCFVLTHPLEEVPRVVKGVNSMVLNCDKWALINHFTCIE